MILKAIKCNYNCKCFKGPIDFEFYPEKVICIIGENGSGKTTLLDFIYNNNIEVNYFNKIKKYYPRFNNISLNLDLIPQEIFDILEIEYMSFGTYRFKKNNTLLNFQDLSSGEQELIKTFNFIYWVSTDIEYDGWGNQINLSKIILLDEPDAHLNSKLRKEFVYLLKKYTAIFCNVQIVFTTHNTEIISDLKEEEVYLCKDNTVKNVGFNTFGERKDILEKKLFRSEYNISRCVENEIEDYRKKIKGLSYNSFNKIFFKDEISRLESEIDAKFCNSVHKNELLKKLEEIKK